MVEAEDRYEKFSVEFLACLPPAFSLNPDTTYDLRCERIPLQRQILHIAMFESICCNFRPVLATNWDNIPNMPSYKRALVLSQKKMLAATSLKLSEAVGALYDFLGAKYTRSVNVAFYTFEAAVILGCLCLDLDFTSLLTGSASSITQTEVLLGEGVVITKETCVDAIANALARLEVLAEVSILAETGAQTLVRLLELIRSADTSPKCYSIGEYSWSDELSNFFNTRDQEPGFKTPDVAFFDQVFSASTDITELDLSTELKTS